MESITLTQNTALSGSINAISSKSDLHRLLICASLADSACEIHFSSKLSKDIQATISCLTALGAEISVSHNTLKIARPIDKAGIPKNASLFCSESGSTARFILPIAALLAESAVVSGAGKLPERPFGELCEALEKMGANLSSHMLPISVNRKMEPENYFEIGGNISSQYISGLLFTLPLCNAKGIKLTTPLESSGYVDLTIDAMRKFGVNVSKTDTSFFAEGSYHSPSHPISAEGDWSNAAFWLCAAKESPVTVTGIHSDSKQPDKKIAEILRTMGMDVKTGKDSITVCAPYGTHAINFDASETPDIVPIVAMRAAISEGTTVISGIRRLRIKESDRVKSVSDMISALGGKIRSDENCIYIDGVKEFSGGVVDSFNDHRIAMSAAIASTFSKGDVTILGSDSVNKSYPEFFEHFKILQKTN